MSCFTALVLVGVFAAALARPDHYTDKYDSINIDEIAGNRRLLVPYVLCLLDKGKCSPEAKELKEHIGEALETDCGKCTENQKTGIRKVIKQLVNHEQDYWNQLKAKYDPESKYFTKYEKELKTITA